MHFRHLRLILSLACLAVSMAFGAAPLTVRVMTYNIHHGEGIDQNLDLERIAKLIVDAKSDIVALQEVDRGVERTMKRDLPAELAKLTGLTAHFEKNIDHQGGQYGNATLTRFPIKRARNTHFKMIGAGEQRGILQLWLDVYGREVLFMNTHLDSRRDEAERVSSAAELAALVAEAGQTPIIACGDFNARPTSATVTKIREYLSDSWELVGHGPGFTIPVKKPTNRIDYVWISRGSIEPVRIEVLQSIASDHLPVLAELRLK